MPKKKKSKNNKPCSYRCPICNEVLTSIAYNDSGRWVWDKKTGSYKEDEFAGDCEFSCPNCGSEITEEMLEWGLI